MERIYLLAGVFGPLLIPLIIVVTRKRTNGALIACSAISLLCYGVLWLSLFGSNSTLFPIILSNNLMSLRYLLYVGGNLLMLVAWVLGLHDAARARRGRWLGLLIITGFLAVAGASFGFNPCELIYFVSGSGSACAPLSPALIQLAAAVPLAGPIAALVYGVRMRGPRLGATLPADQIVSPPAAAADSGDANPDADADLELRTERL